MTNPLPLKNITNSHEATTFSSILFTPTYSGQYKKVESISETEILIKNDSFIGEIKLTAEVAKAIGKNQYNVSIDSTDVLFSYSKYYDFQGNKFVLRDFVVIYEEGWLKNATIVPEPTKSADRDKIITVINTELSAQLQLQINTIKLWMSDFADTSSIGAIYPEGNYTYGFYSFKEQIDMGSIGIQVQQTDTEILFLNKIKGQIKAISNM